MKYRTDFVTNSSSSSFLIHKKTIEEQATIDDVFRLVCKAYTETYQAWIQAVEYLKQYEIYPKLPTSPTGTIYYSNSYQDKNNKLVELYDAKFKTISEDIKDKFNFDVDDYYEGFMPEWIKFQTYAEYLEYHKDKAKIKPFTIIDYSQKSFISLRDLDSDTEDVLNWYAGCQHDYYDPFSKDFYRCKNCKSDGILQTEDRICEYCNSKDIIIEQACISCEKECKQKFFNSTTEYNAQTMLLILGDFCINSWDTDIPYPVAKNISKLCTNFCRHMG